MPSASKVKLADALASGDTRAIGDLTSHIMQRRPAQDSTEDVPEGTPTGLPYRQATAERQ
jgi:hypothetical protein